jgi:hypothetical protein
MVYVIGGDAAFSASIFLAAAPYKAFRIFLPHEVGVNVLVGVNPEIGDEVGVKPSCSHGGM